MTGIKMNWDGKFDLMMEFGCKTCIKVNVCKFGCKEFNDLAIERGVQTFRIETRIDEAYSKAEACDLIGCDKPQVDNLYCQEHLEQNNRDLFY